MPPWGAASGYGHFTNDMSLTGREISLILSWADGGAPSGVLLVDEDKPPVFIPPLNGWELGPPDETDQRSPRSQKVAADSPYRVERFDVDDRIRSRRKWLRALQLNPSDRRVDSLRRGLRRAQRPMARHVDAIEPGERDARRIRRSVAGRRRS